MLARSYHKAVKTNKLTENTLSIKKNTSQYIFAHLAPLTQALSGQKSTSAREGMGRGGCSMETGASRGVHFGLSLHGWLNWNLLFSASYFALMTDFCIAFSSCWSLLRLLSMTKLFSQHKAPFLQVKLSIAWSLTDQRFSLMPLASFVNFARFYFLIFLINNSSIFNFCLPWTKMGC